MLPTVLLMSNLCFWRWIAFLDIDEFIYATDATSKAVDVLRRFAGHRCVTVMRFRIVFRNTQLILVKGAVRE